MAGAAPQPGTRVRILIADHHEHSRRNIRSLLAGRADWSVCGEAADGLEAVAMAKALRPNVVLMDVSMPGLGGIEATRAIQREVPESQVVLISQNDPGVVRQQAGHIDALGYLAKSDLSRELVPTLDRLLGNPSEREAETDQWLRLAVTAAKLGTWQLDSPGLTFRCSPQCKMNFGRSPDDTFSFDAFRAALHPGDRDRVVAALHYAIDFVGEYATEYRCVWPNGEVHWINSRGRALRDGPGEPLRVVGVTQDVTERKLLRERERRKEAEEKLRTLTEDLENQVALRTRELEKRNEEILRQAEQLRALSQRLIGAQDAAGRRIARELHDSAGQLLSLLSMNLAGLARKVQAAAPELAGLSDECDQIARQISQEIRTLSYLLHPPLLDEVGLSSALELYVSGLKERGGLDISIAVAEDLGRLPGELELAAFRVVQECLTNIHRHSGSKTGSIRVAHENGRLLLEVRDQGKGIPPAKLAEIQSTGSGVGFQGIRERIRPYHGSVAVDSNWSGTTVSISLKIPEIQNPNTE